MHLCLRFPPVPCRSIVVPTRTFVGPETVELGFKKGKSQVVSSKEDCAPLFMGTRKGKRKTRKRGVSEDGFSDDGKPLLHKAQKSCKRKRRSTFGQRLRDTVPNPCVLPMANGVRWYRPVLESVTFVS